jgi:ubiquinol-cytochrome c reductase core subunit 2
LKQSKIDAAALALDAAHSVAFHSGLGSTIYPTSATPVSSYISESAIADFASAAYTKANIAVVADGASQAGLDKYVDQFFKSVPATSSSTLSSGATKYYGGEQRTAKTGTNAFVIAFPGYSLASTSPEAAVLVALLGGASSIKWTPGFSLLSKAAAAAPGAQVQTSNLAYSDSGLLAIQISGSASVVRTAAEAAAKALKSLAETPVSKEELTKAIAKAKFDLLSTSETSGSGLVLSGTNLIHGGSTLQVAAAIKSLESVTADKLKTVSCITKSQINVTYTNEITTNRLLRACWRVRLRSLRLVICTYCRLPRSLASRCKGDLLEEKGTGKMYQQ